jgi:hypothetical protein
LTGFVNVLIAIFLLPAFSLGRQKAAGNMGFGVMAGRRINFRQQFAIVPQSQPDSINLAIESSLKFCTFTQLRSRADVVLSATSPSPNVVRHAQQTP